MENPADDARGVDDSANAPGELSPTKEQVQKGSVAADNGAVYSVDSIQNSEEDEDPWARQAGINQITERKPEAQVDVRGTSINPPDDQPNESAIELQRSKAENEFVRTQTFKRKKVVTADEHKVNACENLKTFCKSDDKLMDDEIQKAADKLLRQLCCQHCCVISLQFPFSALGTIPMLAGPYYLGKIIDAFVAKDDATIDAIGREAGIIVLFGILCLVINNYIKARATEILGFTLRDMFFSSIIKKSVSFFDQRKTGEILSRLSGDSEIVLHGLTNGISIMLMSVFLLCGIAFVIFSQSSEMATATLLMMLPICILAPISSRLFQFTSKKTTTVRSEMSSVATEAFGNIRTIKAFASEKEAMEAFKDKNDASFLIGYTGVIYRAWMDGFWQWFMTGAQIGMIWYAAKMFAEEDNEVTTGQIIEYFSYNFIIIGQVMGFTETLNAIFAIKGAFYEMSKLILEEHEQEGFHDEKHMTDEIRTCSTGNVELKAVNFKYPSMPNVPVLKDIQIRVDDNQIVALVGQSGCGKSSIVSLIERFYDPNDGKVFYNGNDIKELDNDWYHKQQIAVVSQEPVLFSESIRHNILYGVDLKGKDQKDPEIEEMVITACKQAHCQMFLEDKTLFPEGLDTKVGERGVRLSGGQKQRVAIARALVRKPRVLLLDEATSALDAESEYEVQQALDELMKLHNQTIIVIAHRLSTIQTADRIIVLKRGAVVEEGTHSDLYAKNGVYKKLVEKQMMTRDLGEEDKELVMKRVASIQDKDDIFTMQRAASRSHGEGTRLSEKSGR